MFTLILHKLLIWHWQRACHASTLYLELLWEKPSNTWATANTTTFSFYWGQTMLESIWYISQSIKWLFSKCACQNMNQRFLTAIPLPSLCCSQKQTPRRRKSLHVIREGDSMNSWWVFIFSMYWSVSEHARFQSVRRCHCRGTPGISFVDTPPPFPTEKREGGRHFPTPPIGLYCEGGAGRVTDKQRRRKRGATVGLQHARSHKYSAGFISVWGQIKCSL